NIRSRSNKPLRFGLGLGNKAMGSYSDGAPHNRDAAFDARNLVSWELEDGELMTWIGRPNPMAVRRILSGLAFVRGIFVTVAIGWAWTISMALMGWDENWDRGRTAGKNKVIPAAIAVLSLLPFGAWVLCAPYWVPRKIERTVYGLTDRRAILIVPRV